MNRKWIQTVLAAMLLLLLLPLAPGKAAAAVPAHSEAFYVNDFANVIDAKTENYMVNYGVKLYQKTGAQVVLVTVDSTNGMSMEKYATSLFNSWGVGSADKNNGVLLLLSIKDDDYWAVPGKGLEKELSNNVISGILSASLEPDFAAKKYSAGANKTYGAFIQKLGGSYSETVGTKNYVSDNAGVFKPVTRDYLNQASNRYAATTGSGVYVVTVKNSGGQSLQDYTYAKFAGVAAGPRDVMLVLDIGGDNYHVLQGKSVDKVLTNERISKILDEVLEPKFEAKDYAGGATGTANEFYSFFLARADAFQGQGAGSTKPAASASAAVASPAKTVVKMEPVSRPKGMLVVGIFLGIIVLISAGAASRNRYVARYGIRLNPYNPRNIRRYGVWTGQPGYGYRQRRSYRRPHYHNHSSGSSSSSSSFWGTNSGGGGSSSGGGAGRYSSRDDDDDDRNSGGGGYSSGGGAGRYSSSSSSSSGGGGNSGGGGSASSGGGVGRHR